MLSLEGTGAGAACREAPPDWSAQGNEDTWFPPRESWREERCPRSCTWGLSAPPSHLAYLEQASGTRGAAHPADAGAAWLTGFPAG